MARPSEHHTEPLRPTKNATDKYAEKQMSNFEKAKLKGLEGEAEEVAEKIDLEEEVEEMEEREELEEGENRRLSQNGLRPDPQRAKRQQRRNGQRGQGHAGEEE